MVSWLLATPGRLYVVATLLPAAACALLLFGGFFRAAYRPYRDRSKVVRFLYFFHGGDTPLRAGAYLATAAIAASAVLAVFGLVRYLADYHALTPGEVEQRWAERTTWARVGP